MTASDYIDWEMVAGMREPQPVTPPAIRRKNQDYYQRNKQHCIQKAKQWREENPEQSKKYMHAYYLKHKKDNAEKRRESAREWHKRFKEQHGISYETFRRRRLGTHQPDATATTSPAQTNPETAQ